MAEESLPKQNVAQPLKRDNKETVDDDKGSAVGLTKTKKIAIMVIAVVVSLVGVYLVTKKSDTEKAKEQLTVKPKREALDKALKNAKNAVQRSTEDDHDVPEISQVGLPNIKDLSLAMPEAPKPPPPPQQQSGGQQEVFNPFDFSKIKPPSDNAPPAPAIVSAPTQLPTTLLPSPPTQQKTNAIPDIDVTQKNKGLDQKTLAARRAGSSIVMGEGKMVGSSSKGNSSSGSADKFVNANSPLRRTSSQQVGVSSYGDRAHLIAEGKMIDIVLETTINTDLKGMIRGVVSSDVYSESGTNILIPKGSRAIGSYSSSLNAGQSRVAIVWNRIMRPDGVDIVLDMNATDSSGRAGVSGSVDYHLAEVMRSSILLSLLTIASGVILTDIFNNNSVTQTINTTTGGVTTSASAAYQQTQNVMNNILTQLQSSMGNSQSTQQTITIAAGTVIKAFVRGDIVFVGNTAFVYKP